MADQCSDVNEATTDARNRNTLDRRGVEQVRLRGLVHNNALQVSIPALGHRDLDWN